jgi:hypothetical protein
MKGFVSSRRLSVFALVGSLLACLSLLPVPLFAGTDDPAANLSACKNGWKSCERSRLTLLEMTEVALAGSARNVSNCKSGRNPCDRWKLTKAEAIATAVATYDRNVSNCKAGFSHCDRSRLTQSEARETAVAEHQRQRAGSNCKNGPLPCVVYSEQTPTEVQTPTPSEAASIPPEVR